MTGRSQSLDDLRLSRRSNDENHVSNFARTEIDLTNIGYDKTNPDNDEDISTEIHFQQSRSAPVSPTRLIDKEFASFIQCEQQTMISDNFVYNIDLSDTNGTSHSNQSKMSIFYDDDDDELIYPVAPPSFIQTNLINSCLTITEENEEELEQLRLDEFEQEEQQKKSNHYEKLHDHRYSTHPLHDDDDRADLLENDEEISSPMTTNRSLIHFEENSLERLSTIYESPSPPPASLPISNEHNDDDDKLIVYDIVEDPSIRKPTTKTVKTNICLSSPTSQFDRTRLRPSYTDATFVPCSTTFKTHLTASNLCGTTTTINSKVFHPPTSIVTSNSIEEISSITPEIKPSYSSLSSLPIHQSSTSRSSPLSLSVPMLLFPSTHQSSEKNVVVISPTSRTSTEHIEKMKVIQSSSTSLSDFLIDPSTTKSHSIHYEEVPNVHRSLTDCSLIQQMSCCSPLAEDEDLSMKTKTKTIENSRRPSLTRRILTNGLLLSHCTKPPLTFKSQQNHRTSIKPKSEEKLSSPTCSSTSSSSSSSTSSSSNCEKQMSRSEYLLQEQDQLSHQRKATSLKNVRIPSKILYPLEFESNENDSNWFPKRCSTSDETKVPTSDSGIVIDTVGTRPTSKSSIDETDVDVLPVDFISRYHLKEYEEDYRQTVTDLTLIKKDILAIESRLNEAMRELEIERALVEGEHDLVFKQIFDANETDQEKLRILYENLQILIDQIMTEKTTLRRQIDHTQAILYKLENEFVELRPSDDKIVKKKEIVVQTRQKLEDLEFQLMELETRYEAELEQAEEHFQAQRILVTQNAKMRQNTLNDLDNQQQMILHQVTMEKDKLEREKQKLKVLFKQKKLEATELEEKMKKIVENRSEKLNEDFQSHVKLRDKTRLQERPLTRYLPVRSVDFDLRSHIEGAGHFVDSPHIHLTSTSCRGFLHKMGGMKFKTWNRRWFVFDRKRRSLFYYQDKTESKLRGCIYFQSIVEVYVDHQQSISLRSPEPREATFILKTFERPFYLVAPTVESMRIWIDVLITGAEGNSFAGDN